MIRVVTERLMPYSNKRLEKKFNARLKIRVSAHIRKNFFNLAAKRRLMRAIQT
jgi:hypothetical protein